jgi:hypothetical protein
LTEIFDLDLDLDFGCTIVPLDPAVAGAGDLRHTPFVLEPLRMQAPGGAETRSAQTTAPRSLRLHPKGLYKQTAGFCSSAKNIPMQPRKYN